MLVTTSTTRTPLPLTFCDFVVKTCSVFPNTSCTTMRIAAPPLSIWSGRSSWTVKLCAPPAGASTATGSETTERRMARGRRRVKIDWRADGYAGRDDAGQDCAGRTLCDPGNGRGFDG